MSLQNRLLVKNCVTSLTKESDKISPIFYRELFHIDIKLKVIFSGNVTVLNRKFSNMLATFKNVQYLEKIAYSVEQMGERHYLDYGVQIQHFSSVKQALLMALAEYLQQDFTTELEQAWQQVFEEVATIMTKAIQRIEQQHPTPQPTNPQNNLDLLNAIGGEKVIHQVHQRFYDVIFAEPWLGQFFYGKSKPALINKQSQFMIAAFGGENHYLGDTPAFVHMHMYITDEMLTLREQILRQAIIDEGLSQQIADQWLNVDQSFRRSIIKKSKTDCVMKCLGQMPITAKKPPDYS